MADGPLLILGRTARVRKDRCPECGGEIGLYLIERIWLADGSIGPGAVPLAVDHRTIDAFRFGAGEVPLKAAIHRCDAGETPPAGRGHPHQAPGPSGGPRLGRYARGGAQCRLW